MREITKIMKGWEFTGPDGTTTTVDQPHTVHRSSTTLCLYYERSGRMALVNFTGKTGKSEHKLCRGKR